ncbi:MAG: hypothetical protein ACYC8S_03675 [Minisyncoccota bacterium]
MTTLHIEQSNLTINVEGADKIWALKSYLTIPLLHIARVEYNPEVARGWWHGIRLPGTYVPGVITAGTFYHHKEWAFWDVHNPEKTIIITLKDERYQKLVIEVKDTALAITEINEALSKSI